MTFVKKNLHFTILPNVTQFCIQCCLVLKRVQPTVQLISPCGKLRNVFNFKVIEGFVIRFGRVPLVQM
jgi:hypothetical protein